MASLLVSQDPTPIAQLNPDLPDQAERVVRGEVTITWPYSSVTQTTAFLLAEPDARLRRAKGQVRIELHGPSAKAFSTCGIGAGDEVLFSLNGAEWAKDESPGRVPRARLDWQLLFNQKLALQAKLSDSNEPKHIDIDHPQPEPPVEHTPLDQPIPTESEVSDPQATPVVRKIADYALDEYPSPAFIKRARISYGSLFEGGLDMFEEDGGVLGKGRKRSRFGRASGAWKYSSQSPSPEPEIPAQDATEEDVVMETQPEPEVSAPDATDVDVVMETQPEPVSVPLPEPELEKASPTPQMTDEGCQTIEFEVTPTHQVPVNQPSQDVSSPVASSLVPVNKHSQEVASLDASSPAPVNQTSQEMVSLGASSPVPVNQPSQEVSSPVASSPAPINQPSQEVVSLDASSPVPVTQPSQEVVSVDTPSPHLETEARAITLVGDSTADRVQRSSPDPAGSVEAAASSLFAISKPINPGFSMFGTTSTVPVASTSDLADQVRFGFSHIPKTTGALAVQHKEPATTEHRASPSPYPHLHVPAKFADMESYVDQAEVEMETAEDRDVSPQPPAVESFDRGGWEMHTHYNGVEGGHFEAHALIDGTRVGAEEASLHTDPILPDMVPEGFDSYGAHEKPVTIVSLDDDDNRSAGSPEDEPPLKSELVENFETRGRSDDEVGVEEDDDAEFDEYGDEIETGDYDQREYNAPADDDEGLSNEDDELEQETAERYGEGDVYNADEERGYYEDGYDEEGYDEEGESEEGSYESEEDGYHQQSLGAVFTAPSKEPVVISLLSDSEDDDDEPPAPPSKQANSPRPTIKEASLQERPMETAAEAATEAAEMAPERETDHQTGDDDDLDNSENQIQGTNDAAALEIIAHENSTPQILEERETAKETVSSSADQSPIASKTWEEKSEVEEIKSVNSSELTTEPQAVTGDGSQGSVLGSDSDQENKDPRDDVDRLEKALAQWDSDEDVDADADADHELEDEFMNIPDEEGDDEENEFADEDQGGLEEIMEEVAEVAEVDDDDVEIIEIDDVEVDQEVDAVGSPMEVEDDLVPQVDSEMREASAEVMSDDESVRDVVSREPEQLEPVVPESREEETGPVREDVLMDDMPLPSPEASLHSHPRITGSGSVETNGFDQAVPDDHVPEDDEGDAVYTSEVIIQQEEQTHTSTSAFNDEIVGVEVSESTKVVTQNRQTEHPTIAPSSPPLTQPVQFRSDSESLPDVPRVSNKNDRPLPLLTPTESFIATQPTPQFTVVEEHRDIELSAHTIAASPKPETDYFDRQGDKSRDTQPNHVSEPDDTGKVGEDSAVSAPSPTLSAIVDQPSTPARSKASLEGETTPLEGSPSSANELEPSQPEEVKSVASEPGTSSPARHLRVTRSGKTPRVPKTNSTQDEITVSSPYSEDREQNQEQSQGSGPSSPDLSINLARQSLAAKRSKKGAEPLRTSPRITRGRSNSLQMSVTSELDEDPSISFARASLASPSKHHKAAAAEVPVPVASTTSLKAELTKGLRKLPECVSLKNIKNHVDKHPNIVAIVASNPTPPSRSKGGPREYMMSFNVTDPSIAPLHVVEVQLYRPHKESLPLVKPGDAILLQKFQVKSLSKKGFGLRTGSESAWAVYEESFDRPGSSEYGADEPPPQIKGPPVEDYPNYSPYMPTLKAWYRSLDTTARNKLDKAVQKFEELGAGNSQK